MVDKKEIWTTEDGKEFTSKDEALAHEKELKDPEYKLKKRIDELEKKIQHLEVENLKRIEEISCIKEPFKLNKDPYQQPGKIWYGVGQNLSDALNNLKEVSEDDR